MNFGEINQYILLGGGRLLLLTAQRLKREGVAVLVVTSKRHSAETFAEENQSMSLLEFLRRNGIEHIISKDITTDANVIKRITENTLGISFGAAWIFKKKFTDLFKRRLVNMHGARLPQNRGGGGFSWRILRGEKTGVSLIHQIDVGIDAGDIILSEEYLYPPTCRIPIEYQDYSIEKDRIFLEEFFDYVKEKRSFDSKPQQGSLSSYWPRLYTDIHGYIDWSMSLSDIERFICAFDDPYNGASTFVNSRKVRLKKCSLADGQEPFHPFQKGIIYRLTAEAAFVAAGEGTLIVNSVLDDSGKDIKEALQQGDRFYTPVKYLEKARMYRAVYTPEGLKIYR